jgi:ribosomal protein S6
MAQDTEIIEGTEGAEDADIAETRVYEFGFHLDAELPQEEAKKIYQSIRDRISAVGTLVAEGEPTKIPLAYTISRQETTGRRDFDSAFFCWIAYEADAAGHEDLLGFLKDIPSIIRFIDIRTDREAAKHAVEMHELFIRNAAEDRDTVDFDDAGIPPSPEADATPAAPQREPEV